MTVTPSPSNTVAAAAGLIRTRLGEIEAERKQLESALEQLTGSDSGRRPRAGRRSGEANGAGTRPARRRKIAPAGQRRQQLLEYLSEHPRSRASEIAKGLGVSSANVHNILRGAVTEGIVEKQGMGYTKRDKK